LDIDEIEAAPPSPDVALVYASMDMFSFNMLHSTIDRYIAEKKWGPLEHATALLLEMTSLLWHMRELDGGLRTVALNVLGNVFFGSDPTDKLPTLLRSWKPATFSRSHLDHLVQLGYTTFKLFGVRSNPENLPVSKDTAMRLHQAKAFDEGLYLKNIATAHVVDLHRVLLEYYGTNAATTNHACVSFFRRLCIAKVPVDEDYGSYLDFSSETNDDGYAPEDEDDSAAVGGGGGGKKTKTGKHSREQTTTMMTYEPLLYNLPFFGFCAEVLKDRAVQGSRTKHAYAELRVLCESVVRHFGTLASSNAVRRFRSESSSAKRRPRTMLTRSSSLP